VSEPRTSQAEVAQALLEALVVQAGAAREVTDIGEQSARCAKLLAEALEAVIRGAYMLARIDHRPGEIVWPPLPTKPSS
jgi:hypothetical protein